MKYYIDTITQEISAYESDGSQDEYIKPGLAPISVADLAALRAPTVEQRIAEYTAALQAHLDSTAQAHGYDTIYTAALRAGFTGPFQAEGVAFAQWMDACWSNALTQLANYQANPQTIPTLEAIIAQLPELVLP
ncbi:MAG: hypothetical protein PHW53_04995 [Patescibacteria group bacterium]|nr:hypothetical protein [Patescibacteria group bacterium]